LSLALETTHMALLDKIRGAKDKLERATFEEKAKTRARERRVDKGEPEGFTETAEVAAKETKELGGQAKEFVGAAVPGGAKKAGEKSAGVLGALGEGGSNVIDDIESGGGIDVVDTSSKSASGGLDPFTMSDDNVPDRDDAIESIEADIQHERNRRKGDDSGLGADMSGFDDDLDMFD